MLSSSYVSLKTKAPNIRCHLTLVTCGRRGVHRTLLHVVTLVTIRKATGGDRRLVCDRNSRSLWETLNDLCLIQICDLSQQLHICLLCPPNIPGIHNLGP